MVLLLSVGLALSPCGNIRLGGEGAKPDFSRISWICLLIAAGMGSGLIFWGVAEPLTHYHTAPVLVHGKGDPRWVSLGLTYFHWGAHAWSLYAITGLILAWFSYNRKRPLLISSAFAAGKQAQPYKILDFIALVAVIFGVAGTLANSIALIQTGVERLFDGIELGLAFRLILLFFMAFIFISSSMLGLKKGIQQLSLFNMIFALLLLFIVMAWSGIFSTFYTVMQSTWSYIDLLPTLSFSIDQHSSWSRDWTVIYLLWWMCWTPFVGPFIARISFGRTVRELLLFVIFVPTVFTIFWFSAFTSQLYQLPDYLDETLKIVQGNYTGGLFQFFSYLPLGYLLSILAVLLLITFVITSADSALYVASIFTGKTRKDSSKAKLLWGALLVSIALGLVARNDVDLNKHVAIIGAIPFSLIMVFQIMAFLLDMSKYAWKSQKLHWSKNSGRE